jgi:hypothetical protein
MEIARLTRLKQEVTPEFIDLGLKILTAQNQLIGKDLIEITETFNKVFDATLTVNDIIPHYQLQLDLLDAELMYKNFL